MTAIELNLSGWVLRPPRVAESNAITTSQADTMEGSGFNPSERSDYMVAVQNNARCNMVELAWVKNTGRSVFGFTDSDQRWAPLNGRSPLMLGEVSNVEYLVMSPIPTGTYASRLFITDPSSIALIVNVVSSGIWPGTPSSGEVNVNGSTGQIAFSLNEIDNNEGDSVYYQTEAFIDYRDESMASLGTLSDPIEEYRLALNPIPESDQHPIIRVGNRIPLVSESVLNEAGFTDPNIMDQGTVEWSEDKGTLNFSQADIDDYAGETLYYRGVYDFISDGNQSLSIDGLGTVVANSVTDVTATGILNTIPSSGGDIVVYFDSGTYKQIAQTKLVSIFSDFVEYGVVEIKTTVDSVEEPGIQGSVRFNYSEVKNYHGDAAYAVIGDFELVDEDVVLRLFRSLVNKDGSSPVPDFTCYVNEDSVLIEKMIASPIIPLPVSPLEPAKDGLNAPSFTVQGKTNQILTDLKRSVSPDIGFVINYETKELTLAERKKFDTVASSLFYDFDDVSFLSMGFNLREGPEAGPNTDLVEGDDYLLETNAGAVFFIDRKGRVLENGTRGQMLTLSTFEDTTGVDFSSYVDKQLVILSGTNAASYIVKEATAGQITINDSIPFASLESGNIAYEIWDAPEILGDRVWDTVPIPEDYFQLRKLYMIGEISNINRPTIPVINIDARIELRVGSGTITIPSNNWIDTNSGFGTPNEGEAEISLETGDVNFADADLITYVGGDVVVSWWLNSSDYLLNQGNGGILLNTPMMGWERLEASYYSEDDTETLIIEYLSTRIWGEDCVIVPGSSEVSFNTDSRETLDSLGIKIYRGNKNTGVGRFYTITPTELHDKVAVDWVTNTLRFVTDLTSDDEVEVEYYIQDMVGGEKAFTLNNFPVLFPVYEFTSGTSQFNTYSDQTSIFIADKYILLGNGVYRVTGSSFADGITTVDVASTFRSSLRIKDLPISSSVLDQIYFEPVSERFERVSIGSNTLVFNSIISGIGVGTILNLDGDDYLVLGVNIQDGKTVVGIGSTFAKEYYYSPGDLEYSIRRVFSKLSSSFISNIPLVTTEPFTLRLRNDVSGTVEDLVLDTHYSVSESGVIIITDMTKYLDTNSILEFNYAGRKTYDGQEISGEYICRIVPDNGNLFLGSSLLTSYTVYNPDTFYFRVESFDTIAAEVSIALGSAAASASPSSGPPGPPPAPLSLNEKGKGPYYWEYGDTVDNDAVARRYLLFWNDVCNRVEDLLTYLDGRVVGDVDGKFLFTDSLYTDPVEPGNAVNHIDSVIYTSPNIPFAVRKYLPMWKGSKYSRLYPEYGKFFNLSAPGDSGGVTYDYPADFLKEIVSIGRENLASVSGVRDRSARTKLLNQIAAGLFSAVLEVDSVDPDTEGYQLPGFSIDDEIMVGREGSSYLIAGVITDLDDTLHTLSVRFVAYNETPTIPPAPPPPPYPEEPCPELLPNDTVYWNPFWWVDDGSGNPIAAKKTYKSGMDYGVDLKTGNLLNTSLPFQLPGQDPIVPEIYVEGNVSFGNGLVKPYRFPALDGGVNNDWSDLSVPFKISDAASFDVLFEDENGLIINIEDNTLEGVRGIDGVVSSDLQTFEGALDGENLQTNDLLVITNGSNIGEYLICSFPTVDSVKVAAFQHEQDINVNYEITGPVTPYSGTNGTIQNNLLVFEDSTKNFLTGGNEVVPGHILIVNFVSGYSNEGTYIVESVTATTVSVRVFNTAASGIYYDIKRGHGSTERSIGVNGWFETVTKYVDVSANFSADNVVRGDALVISNGKNRGNWEVDEVLSPTELVLQDSVRFVEEGSGDLVLDTGKYLLNVIGTVFQSSDVGRKLLITDSSNDGSYTIISYINEGSVEVSSWPNALPDTGTWALCSDYRVDGVRRGSQYVADWEDKLSEEQTEWNDGTLQNIITDLFDTFFGSTITSGSGEAISTTEFQDVSKGFVNLGVAPGDVLEIASGVNMAYWWVTSVGTDTLVVENNLGNLELGAGTYQVWEGNTLFSVDMRRTMVDFMNLQDSVLSNIVDALNYAQTNTNPNYGDPTDTWLGARKVTISNNRSDLADAPESFEIALKYIDKLYDKRYSWVNFRINLENGTLPIKERLIADKEKQEIELIEKLLMVLT